MEPISVSFEVGEPAPGRESMQQAQHRGQSLTTSHQDSDFKPERFQVWQISLFVEAQWGDVLQRHLPPRESNFLS